MASIILFLQNNRILTIYDLKEMSILYYPAYNLYALYYWDNYESKKLIYSSESFLQLLQIEIKISEAYQNGITNLILK